MIYVVGTESCWLKGSRQPFIKIGTTIDLRQRMAKMQTDNPQELKVHYLFNGGADREAELHAMLHHFHYRAEWFRTWVGQEPIKPWIEGEWFQGDKDLIVLNRGVIS